MDILIKIRISEEEYTKWGDFQRGGVDNVIEYLKFDLENYLSDSEIEGELDIKLDE